MNLREFGRFDDFMMNVSLFLRKFFLHILRLCTCQINHNRKLEAYNEGHSNQMFFTEKKKRI